jgi:hypothetical protein
MASNLLEQIHFLGNDQVSNQFDFIMLKSLPGIPIDPRLLQFRLHDDFQIPVDKFVVKEIFSRGKKILKPYPKEDIDKRLTCGFRLDGGWLVYNAFYLYKKKILNPKFLSSSEDQKKLKTEITFIGKSPSGKKIMIFKKCMLESIELTPFNHSNADPVICKVVFNYLEKEEDLDLLGF